MAMLWVVLRIRRTVTDRAGKRVAALGTKKQQAKGESFHSHVISRSRFIFR